MGSDPGTGYLNAQDAAALDAELMSTPGFSLEQLVRMMCSVYHDYIMLDTAMPDVTCYNYCMHLLKRWS